ncbi:hypothetical protein, partial [Streptococcus sobrinus]|uniref:hypothetical protein n=1 Tax=Streptococcus sobrinus TaxID=1310 RepID=UPI001C4013A4
GELLNAVQQYKFPCFVLFSFERTFSQLNTVQSSLFFSAVASESELHDDGFLTACQQRSKFSAVGMFFEN